MRRLIVPLFVAAIAGSACGGNDNGGTPVVATTSQPVAPGEVVVANISYTPVTITIAAGQQVTWRFDDNGVPHTATADADSPQQFNSQQKSAGTYVVKFPNAGRYPYHCDVHAKMHGAVVVS